MVILKQVERRKKCDRDKFRGAEWPTGQQQELPPSGGCDECDLRTQSRTELLTALSELSSGTTEKFGISGEVKKETERRSREEKNRKGRKGEEVDRVGFTFLRIELSWAIVN